jgi:hydrogenase large subunit
MDRTIARVLEANKIAEVIGILLDHLIPLVDTQKQYEVPAEGMGLGLVDTTRGPLGHWIKINDSRISFYQVITPSVWNVSSRGNDGRLGTMEMALVGTYIKDEENPVELGRIMRSFDPCVSCATHVYCKGKEPRLVTIIP